MNRRQFTKAMAIVASGTAAGLVPTIPAASTAEAVMTLELFPTLTDVSHVLSFDRLLTPEEFAAVVKYVSDEIGQLSRIYVHEESNSSRLLDEYSMAVWDMYHPTYNTPTL